MFEFSDYGKKACYLISSDKFRQHLFPRFIVTDSDLEKTNTQKKVDLETEKKTTKYCFSEVLEFFF